MTPIHICGIMGVVGASIGAATNFMLGNPRAGFWAVISGFWALTLTIATA